MKDLIKTVLKKGDSLETVFYNWADMDLFFEPLGIDVKSLGFPHLNDDSYSSRFENMAVIPAKDLTTPLQDISPIVVGDYTTIRTPYYDKRNVFHPTRSQKYSFVIKRNKVALRRSK